MSSKKQKTRNNVEFDEDNYRIFTKIKDYEPFVMVSSREVPGKNRNN